MRKMIEERTFSDAIIVDAEGKIIFNALQQDIAVIRRKYDDNVYTITDAVTGLHIVQPYKLDQFHDCTPVEDWHEEGVRTTPFKGTPVVFNPGHVPIRLVEKLADAEHASWARWTLYQFSMCLKREDGALVIPADLVDRWTLQANTPYPELSETEKESDRKEVRIILPYVAEYMDRIVAGNEPQLQEEGDR